MSGRLGRLIWYGRTPDLRSLHKIPECSLPMRNTCARSLRKSMAEVRARKRHEF